MGMHVHMGLAYLRPIGSIGRRRSLEIENVTSKAVRP